MQWLGDDGIGAGTLLVAQRDTLLSGVLALVLTEIEQTGNPIAWAPVTRLSNILSVKSNRRLEGYATFTETGALGGLSASCFQSDLVNAFGASSEVVSPFSCPTTPHFR